MLPVVPRVMYAEAAERNIAHGAVKEAVRQCCFLIAAGIDVRRLVELPCNARGNMVQLHAVKPGGVCIKLLRAAAENAPTPMDGSRMFPPVTPQRSSALYIARITVGGV